MNAHFKAVSSVCESCSQSSPYTQPLFLIEAYGQQTLNQHTAHQTGFSPVG